MNASLKRKDAFFVSEWLRQRGREKLCEIFESYNINLFFCMINATTLPKRVRRDDKIIMFISLSVICLSFTI